MEDRIMVLGELLKEMISVAIGRGYRKVAGEAKDDVWCGT